MTPDPLSHPCKSRHCRAQRDEPCRTRNGQPCPPHAKRRRAAERITDLLPDQYRDGLPVAAVLSVSSGQVRIGCGHCCGIHVVPRTPYMAAHWSKHWVSCGGTVMLAPLVRVFR